MNQKGNNLLESDNKTSDDDEKVDVHTLINKSKSNDDAKYSPEAIEIKDNKWKQLKCETTTLTYGTFWVKCVYVLIAVIFIPLGIWTYTLSQSVTMQHFEPYSEMEPCQIKNYDNTTDWGKECIINYTINYDFNPPIYFYYYLTNMYQNQRNYVQSRTENQLDGEDLYDVSDCDSMFSYNNSKMLPCGLIAYSFFNDKFKVNIIRNHTTYELCNNNTQCNANETTMNWTDASWYAEPNWSKQNIAWSSDHSKFKTTNLKSGLTRNGELQNWQSITLPNTGDEDLMVWMRTASHHSFSKLHRIITNESLKAGDVLQVTIRNYFASSSFQGKKSIIISTVSSIGGRDDTLGIGFIVIGSLSLLVAVLFTIFIPTDRIGRYPIEVELHIDDGYKMVTD